METPEAADSLLTSKPRTRMENWQRKLLDLSLRNNLLNTRSKSKYQLRIQAPGVAMLEDALADGAAFRIHTLSEEDWAAYNEAGQDARSAEKQATAMFRRRELLVLEAPSALQRTLRAIYSAARREMEESGVNTLYIACGFLRWEHKGASYRAPLLLLPVRLSRANVKDGFILSGMGEDAQINNTLLELLKTEYSLRLPSLEAELPTDEAGLDVPTIFATVREAIAHLPGWEVEESSLLGLFSFAKYLMWRDLSTRQEELLQNDVVRRLVSDDRRTFPEQSGFPDLHTLDNELDAHKVYTPLAADSSQLAAIIAAARGKSFVLEGPPGTGKSQTIANMIAHCLGHGKTVLFVAEKAVALEVVHKRLERIGLGDFCLELHSNKTQTSAVMQTFREAVAGLSEPPVENEWDEGVDTMMELRRELNSLPGEMHTPRPDGESLYDAVCTLAASAHLPTLPPHPAAADRESRKQLLHCVHELVAHFGLLSSESARAAAYISAEESSPAWEEALQTALQEAKQAAEQQEKALTATAEQLGAAPEQAATWRPALLAALHPAAAAGDCSALLPHCAGRALSALQQVAEHASAYRSLRSELSLPYPESAAACAELPRWLSDAQAAISASWPWRWLTMRKLRKALQAQAMSSQKPDCLRDLQTLSAMSEHRQAILTAEADIPAFLRKGVDTDEAHLHTVRSIAALLEKACGEDDTPVAELLRRREEARYDVRLRRKEEAYHAAFTCLQEVEDKLTPLLHRPCRLSEKCADAQGSAWAEHLLACRSSWREITLWNKKAAEAHSLGIGAWADALLRGDVKPADFEAAAAAALAQGKLGAAVPASPVLRDFAPLLHEEKIRDFATEDKDLRTKTGTHIRRLLRQRAAGISRHGQETSVLQREIMKKRMHMPLRKLLSATPNITPLLKPCFLMSPLSVAQYLTEDTQPFDIVIFDEASQIPVWDAIGAIGRGKSVIITGDSRQMPPTSFFSRNSAEEDEDAEQETDMESILEECLVCGVPKMSLTWHYRSKSEALIAFSNRRYYEGRMTTFPAPALRDTALQLHTVNGLYESGAGHRVNPQEARAVVEHVLATLRTPGFRYTEASSIGIVTFNAQQQKLISDMLEEARAEDLALEPFFAEENPEAVFVKNLENVQGDERGVIYFSTTYGRDAEGRFSMNFGPLNLTGGERRLNVAITRARYAMHVFTSMQPEEIDLSRTHARGVEDLRAFLEYARAGQQRTAADSAAADALAQHIAEQLRQRGYSCTTGLGASDYRVDIAIAHPEQENGVLAGITLDGAGYYAAHTARDRDVVRPDTMYLLGWRMVNVWAIDWWRSPGKCLEALLHKLEKLRSLPQEQGAELPDLAHAPAAAPAPKPAAPTKPEPQQPREVAESYSAYVHTDAPVPPFEMTDRALAALMLNIADAEAPLAHELLMERLAAAAPLPSAGRKSPEAAEQARLISSRLEHILRRLVEHEMLSEHEEARTAELPPLRIITQPGAASPRPRTAGGRELTLIPPSELQQLANAVQALLKCLPGSDEHLRGICHALGIRATGKAKDYLHALLLTAPAAAAADA